MEAAPQTSGQPAKQQSHLQPLATRLIVKNLPKHADDARLKKHFSSLGTVTDAKVVRTKGGKSRLFGFVGYATEKDAAKALKHFDNTFLDTSRLAVQLAKPRGDGEIARPWSKYSAGSNKAAKAAAAAAGGGEFEVHVSRGHGGGSDSGSESEEQDRKSKGQVKELEKQEFMEAMQRRSSAKFWANDDASAAAAATALSSSAQADTKQKRNKRAAVSAAQADDSSSGGSSDSASDAGGSAAQSDEGSDDDDGDAGASKSVSDMDWLRAKQEKVPENASAAKKKRQRSGSVTSSTSDDSDGAAGVMEAESGASPEADSGDHTSKRGAKAGGKGTAAAAEGGGGGASIRGSSRGGGDGGEGAERTGRLFVRNLAYACTEEDLSELFGGYGALEGVHVTVDDMNRCKGFAFVQFVDAEHAGRALEALDGRSFQGRLLHVIPARKAPGENGAGTAAGGGGTFKAQREKERRARAQDGVGWNASFVRGDTVVDALADRLGVGKGEVLDREEGDMAVRLALGETQLIAENKEYFRREGVDLDALTSQAGKPSQQTRSTTVILVKNLPHTAAAADLVKLFSGQSGGSVERVLLPPSRSVALVEFGTAVDARRAFKRLAYTRYQHVPLYLEWAPLGIFKEGAPKSKQALPSGEHAVGAIAGVSADGSAAATDAAAADEDQDANAGTANTVYVKNLAWATTEDGLRRCFEAIGAIRAVAIPRKKPPAGSAAAKDAPPGGLSMGFGFVEFAAAASAKTAVATLQGTILDGHALELKHSTKRLAPVPKPIGVGGGGKKRSKLIARNVAFQATARELRELFGAYGQLQRVRMPKKFDGSHRGFAFIDFATAQEASNAFQALASTHLYGRHLVLEWAEEDSETGDVSALREKAAKDVRGALAAKAGKRRKLDEDGGFGDGGGDFD